VLAGTSDRTSAGPARLLLPPSTPWSVRVARGTGGRAALEVYAGESVVDVVVAPSRGGQLLRGACSMVVAGESRTLAWGCLPVPGGPVPGVEFSRGRVFPRRQGAQAASIASWFWLAAVDGRFTQVAAASPGTDESCRVLAVVQDSAW
jgi:hypothetical protein